MTLPGERTSISFLTPKPSVRARSINALSRTGKGWPSPHEDLMQNVFHAPMTGGSPGGSPNVDSAAQVLSICGSAFWGFQEMPGASTSIVVSWRRHCMHQDRRGSASNSPTSCWPGLSCRTMLTPKRLRNKCNYQIEAAANQKINCRCLPSLSNLI